MTSGLADTSYNLILSTINIFEALNFVDITFTRGFLKISKKVVRNLLFAVNLDNAELTCNVKNAITHCVLKLSKRLKADYRKIGVLYASMMSKLCC